MRKKFEIAFALKFPETRDFYSVEVVREDFNKTNLTSYSSYELGKNPRFVKLNATTSLQFAF
jgi:hypothetical protein